MGPGEGGGGGFFFFPSPLFDWFEGFSTFSLDTHRTSLSLKRRSSLGFLTTTIYTFSGLYLALFYATPGGWIQSGRGRGGQEGGQLGAARSSGSLSKYVHAEIPSPSSRSD